MEKETFIEEILNCADTIKPVAPSEDLFYKIQNKMEVKSHSQEYSKWLIAASIAVLISINTVLLFSKTKMNTNKIAVLVENTDNQIY